MSEKSVAQRWAIVQKAAPKLRLPQRKKRALEEVLYTGEQASGITKMDVDEAVRIWSLVQLAQSGGVTEDMKL